MHSSHTWYTVEDFNNTLYTVVKRWINYGTTYAAPKYHGYALKISNGNYTGLSIANEIQENLQTSTPDLEFTCSYHIATGKLTIKAGTDQLLKLLPDGQVICMPIAVSDPWVGWKDNDDNVISVDFNNLQSRNEVFRNTHLTPWDPFLDPYINDFTSEFLDLLNVHNINSFFDFRTL